MEAGTTPATTPPADVLDSHITHSCGHRVRHSFASIAKGTNSVRERRGKEAWLGRQPCKDCYLAARQAEADQLEGKFPDLQGSEKQVKWAEQIRAQMFKGMQIDDDYEKLGSDELAAQFRACRQKLDTETSAKWYIEHRGGFGELFNAVVAERKFH